MKMFLRVCLCVSVSVCVCLLAGCTSFQKGATQSASQKNLNLDGYLMLGELETANTDNATPTGKMILGRLTYKSRKVGIPADQKVPTTGYFKSTMSKSLFGTEEHIIEYDFTSGSDAEAKAAAEKLEALRKEAEAKASSAVSSAAAGTSQTSTPASAAAGASDAAK